MISSQPRYDHFDTPPGYLHHTILPNFSAKCNKNISHFSSFGVGGCSIFASARLN